MKVDIQQVPEIAAQDALKFREKVNKYLANDIPDDQFRKICAGLGIYAEKQNGKYLVRVRGVAGLFTLYQLERVAELSASYSMEDIHFTTRQDIQLHGLSIEDTPIILEELLKVGLYTRGSGGDTVRSITVCSMAGFCTRELFDVTPYSTALTQFLMESRSSFLLPRKFKVAFSGCSKDCALGSVTDLGFFAHVRDGIKGFSVYAGGGMGANPRAAVRIEEFISADDIFVVAEALKQLFNEYGDRSNRSKARLRYVVERLGEQEFVRLYKEQLEQVRDKHSVTPQVDVKQEVFEELLHPLADSYSESDKWFKRNVVIQKQHGLFSIRILLRQGLISPLKLKAVAKVASGLEPDNIRATQEQNLLIHNVPERMLNDLHQALLDIDAQLVSTQSVRCVACTGAPVCRIGTNSSRELAKTIERELSDVETEFDVVIRISGCRNACAQHQIAKIGLCGLPSSPRASMVASYNLLMNGHASEDNSRFGTSSGPINVNELPGIIRKMIRTI